MEQQSKNLEERGVKIFYVENMLRNKYGLKSELSKFLSEFIINFSENLYENYDYEKVKHIRNAQSNFGMLGPRDKMQEKIIFYVGLMDKDDFSYKFSKQEAIEKIVEIIGDCTIQETFGTFTRNDGKIVQIETLVVTKYLEKNDPNYVHFKTKELKHTLNQSSILTEQGYNFSLDFNNESENLEKEIEYLMQEYDWTWRVAKDALENGWY
jgi:hypothetical protein